MAGISRVRRWFSSVSYLPSWGEDLRRFMSGTIGLTTGLIFSKNSPRIVWGDIDSAFADRPNNRIVISEHMVGEFKSKRPRPDVEKDDAIAAVLGTLVHEIAHFVYSPDDLLGLLNAGVPKNRLATTVANLVEDVYIEHAIVERERSFDWMISACWDYFFPEKVILKSLKKWDGKSFADLAAVINVMISWKNGNYYFTHRTEKEEELYKLLMSARGMHVLQDRKDLIERIYKFLLEEHKSETGEDLEAKDKAEKAEESQGGDNGSIMDSVDLDGKRATTDGTLVEVGSVRPSEEYSDATEITKRSNFVDFSAAGGMGVAWIALKQGSAGRLYFNKKWLEFRRWAHDQGSARRIRGHAGNSGKLTHPARLKDDGKVFSKAYVASASGSLQAIGAPQTIILVDLSGSMGSRMRSGVLKVSAACEAAQGAMEGLVAARHRVAVFGHSTLRLGMGSETCAIYVAKEFSDTLEAGTSGLFNMSETGALANNADSYAIEAVASRFKLDGSPCHLFVISDGEPACWLYSGDDGETKTKAAVDKLRRKGIEVYSFSIDSDALAANNRIYGPKNNFDAQDIDVVRQVLKKFV